MKKTIFLLPLLLFAACGPKDGVHELHLLTTNDVHGRWFDSTYVQKGTRQSLMAVNYYVDSIRKADGAENVLLVDAGDCLQGDNASYYYNYVDTGSEHLFSRLVSYMKYDAVTVGNHDVETGHAVYDRVAKELKKHGIPFLGGNAVRDDNGKSYFPLYKTFKRAGLKVLVLGYTNANNPAWMDESLWSGMHFESLLPRVQEDVDRIAAKEKADVVVVSVHSATGDGDGRSLEAQGLDLYKSLSGVDFLVCSHDHREVTFCNDSIALINTGNRAKYLGHGKIRVSIKDGKVADKEISSGLIKVDKRKTDPLMREAFMDDYKAVKAFSTMEIGALAMDLRTRDAYSGMCDYVNLIHSVCLKESGAQVSFAAPLTFNGVVRAGVLIYNDLFTIYPFENQLYTMKLTGEEIRKYLEFSYSRWLAKPGSEHVLNIARVNDPRNNQEGWSFVYRAYNFDSAAGINYTVDVTKPAGERVQICSMADGSAFDPKAEYTVAMTSYRASGAGGLLTRGAGIPEDELEGRIVHRYREIRECIYDYIEEYGLIDDTSCYSAARNGAWKFIPEDVASRGIAADLELLF
ncbi:MAG: 5'-nucleotidase C-terminal domain-containing protein [Bacteroidales bacterium]|nr:5'-nucleotidase C-terminal domain-containing protein [Bacteroidales bacterium]